MKLWLEDVEMDEQLKRTATAVCSGSTDLGEVIATAACRLRRLRRLVFGMGGPGRQNGSRRRRKPSGWPRAQRREGFPPRDSEYWRQAILFIRHDLQDPRLLKG